MGDHWRITAQALQGRLLDSVLPLFSPNLTNSFSHLSLPTRQAYLLLADQLADKLADKLAAAVVADKPLLVGIGGGQGAGKSTLVAFVAELLNKQYGLRVQTLSLDDFYLTRAERQALAETVHPLLATRGVPGTHDIACLSHVLDQLQQGGTPAIPQFDKATDDRVPRSRGSVQVAAAEPDIVLLEGWCIGAQPESEQELLSPVNPLESERDPDGTWRTWVNQQLASDYADLFRRLDQLVFLQVPDMAAVSEWRFQQEQQLAAQPSDNDARLTSREDINRFVQYYERITRSMLRQLPSRADTVLVLSPEHHVQDIYHNAT